MTMTNILTIDGLSFVITVNACKYHSCYYQIFGTVTVLWIKVFSTKVYFLPSKHEFCGLNYISPCFNCI